MTDDESEYEARRARRARRAWIAANHPDRGGNPDWFAEGLRRVTHGDDETPAQQPTVYRSRSPWRRVRHLIHQARRSRRGLPPRRLS